VTKNLPIIYLSIINKRIVCSVAPNEVTVFTCIKIHHFTAIQANMASSTLNTVGRPAQHKALDTASRLPSPVEAVAGQYLTTEEESQIQQQFLQACSRGRQVLWTGIGFSEAQKWADDNDMQTLTTAMGPLMDIKSPRCPRHRKSVKAWSKYIHGASALFAWYISGGEVVTVLCQPPPDRFNPSQGTYYQTIEEPIIKGKVGGRRVQRIEVVHPTLQECSDFAYQIWPIDEVGIWKKRYGTLRVLRPRWRRTKAIVSDHEHFLPIDLMHGLDVQCSRKRHSRKHCT
jgi:hypothetical protein